MIFNTRILALAAVAALATTSALATVITFDPLSGSNGDAYVGHSEGGYTITATSGQWFEGHSYGNPVPDIFSGPIYQPVSSTIEVTKDDGGYFHFVSVDASSNSASTGTLEVLGYHDGNLEFAMGAGFSSDSTFETKSNPFDFGYYNKIDFTLAPGDGVTSMNLDNIVLNAVPEPASMALVLGGMGLLARRRRNKA